MAHEFGGTWTEQKLEVLRKYLSAYTQILKGRTFRFAYIDAFAGTGERTVRGPEDTHLLKLRTEEERRELLEFQDGSARIALATEPPFQTLIFIERDSARAGELEVLAKQHPQRDIRILSDDANVVLQELASKDWSGHRAVLFLDPYGMAVTWETLEAIARTKAMDVWYLFPLGIGVNRLLRRDGQIPPAWQHRLTETFGTSTWKEAFYAEDPHPTLFEDEPRIVKTADYSGIEKFLLDRLETIFAGVSRKPLRLANSRGCPLYLLCFAVGNPHAVKPALRIANDILVREL